MVSTVRRGVVVGVVAACAVTTPATTIDVRPAPSPAITASPLWRVEGRGRGRPATDGPLVYFLSAVHEVLAVDGATGLVRWRSHTGQADATTWGSQVVVAGGTVVAGDWDLFGFDASSGARKWRFTPDEGYGPGVQLGQASGGVVFAGSPAGLVYAIDAASGEPMWTARAGDGAETTVYEPVSDGEIVVAGYTRFATPQTGGVVALDAATGRERWRTAFPMPATPFMPSGSAGGPLLAGDQIVAASADGRIWVMNRTSGAAEWSMPPIAGECGRNADSADHRALAHVGRQVFAASLSGCVVGFDLDTRTALWRYSSPRDGSAAVRITAAGQDVYVPYYSGRLAALDAADGRERWRTGQASDGFVWAPAVAGDRVYAAGSGLGFVAFRR
jgi:outer membrane protein assembly factor BamB